MQLMIQQRSIRSGRSLKQISDDVLAQVIVPTVRKFAEENQALFPEAEENLD